MRAGPAREECSYAGSTSNFQTLGSVARLCVGCRLQVLTVIASLCRAIPTVTLASTVVQVADIGPLDSTSEIWPSFESAPDDVERGGLVTERHIPTAVTVIATPRAFVRWFAYASSGVVLGIQVIAGVFVESRVAVGDIRACDIQHLGSSQ